MGASGLEELVVDAEAISVAEAVASLQSKLESDWAVPVRVACAKALGQASTTTLLPFEAVTALHTKLEIDSASVQKACVEALGQASTMTPLPPKAILALQNQLE